MPVGWGIIGIGKHAGRFMAPALSRAAGTKFVAVCSRSMERAKSFAAEHGAERAYDSLAKMLADPELDVLYVATPNSLHAQQVIEAAEAGKHVLCEKPMALTESDCERMIEACNKNKVKLGVDFQNRYHPAHVQARRLVQDGKVGEINFARAQYCHGFAHGHWQQSAWRTDPTVAGAGAVVATAVHPIDLLRFLLGSEVTEVRALCEPETRGDIDEMVYVILKFDNGARGVVVSGILVPRSDNDAVLYGKEARITCRGTVGMRLEGELLVEGDTLDMRVAFPTNDPMQGNYIGVVEAFNNCLEKGTELDISGYNGLQMVRITNAILESSRQGKALKLAG